MSELHELFWSIVKKLPTDYEPYGQRSRTYTDENNNGVDDCSCMCKHFHVLEEMPLDWGACTNSKSPRCGLLTFEHQGCFDYELDEAQLAEFNDQIKGMKALKRTTQRRRKKTHEPDGS